MFKLIILVAVIVVTMNIIHNAGYNLDNVEPRQVRMIEGAK